MNSKNKLKEFDTVKTFREIKEKISKEIADMNIQEIKAYLKTKKVRLIYYLWSDNLRRILCRT